MWLRFRKLTQSGCATYRVAEASIGRDMVEITKLFINTKIYKNIS